MPLLALPPAPVVIAAAPQQFLVRPALGGRQSTFSVKLPLATTRWYRVSILPRCLGRRGAYPWTQILQLPGRDWGTAAATVQFARPLGGWCPGRFRGTVSVNTGRAFAKLGRFTFSVKPRVRTPLPERPCMPRGSKTIAQNAHARVFTIRSGKLTFTDGCLFTLRMQVQLGAGLSWSDDRDAESDSVWNVRLAGHYVSYVLNEPGPVEAERSLVVADLRTARRWAFDGADVQSQVLSPTGMVVWIGMNWDDTYPSLSVRELGPSGSRVLDVGPVAARPSVDSLILARAGSTAWAALSASGRTVRCWPRRGGVRILDDAAGIDATSLRLVRGRLRWRRGAQSASAPVC